MKKKMVIELLLYIVLVIVGIILMFTYKPDKPEIIMPNDFQIERSE